MALIDLTCPHCHVERVQFRSIAAASHIDAPYVFTVFFVCNACTGGVASKIALTSQHAPNPHEYPGDLRKHPALAIGSFYPTEEDATAPAHTPDNVVRFYTQATDNLKRGNWDAAGGMFRKVLDAATKKLDPTLSGKLVARIDRLAETQKITPELREWAHAIRVDGNDATHEDDPTEEADAKRLASFTELFLMYVFTLPGMLKERKEKPIKGA